MDFSEWRIETIVAVGSLAANVVRPVHAKARPVTLTTPAEFDAWLSAGPEEALKLQRPLPAGRLKIVAKGERNDAAPSTT